MSFSLPTDINTASAAIPIVGPGKQGKLSGVTLHFSTFGNTTTAGTLAYAVAQEQANVTAGTPIWVDGQTLSNGSEPGVSRRWNATAAHARLLSFGNGKTYLLASDSAKVYSGTTTSVPASGTAVNDVLVDYIGGSISVNVAGAWSSTSVRVVVATQSDRINFFATKWTAARARGATSPARMLFVGDSNTVGEGSSTGTSGLTGAFGKSFAHLTAAALGCVNNSFFGDQNTQSTAQLALYDPRLSFDASGWTIDTSGTAATTVPGGRFILNNGNSATGLLKFNAGIAFDSFKLYTPRDAIGAASSVDVLVDGTVVGNLNQNGTGAFITSNFAVTRGTHTIALRNNATTAVIGYCIGIEVFDSTSAAPLASYAAGRGFLAATLASTATAYANLNALPTMGFDSVVISAHINDANSQTAINAYDTSLYSMVKAYSANSDVVIVVGYPSGSTIYQTNGFLDQMVNRLKLLARSYGCGFIDLRETVYGSSNAIAVDRGFTYNNDHPNFAGYTAASVALTAYMKSCGFA